MIQLLHQGALRLEDIVGPTFADFKRIQPNAEGFRVMHFDAKKTTARQVPFDQDAYDAIEAYQKEINAKDEDIIFPPGQIRNPTNKYVNWI